MRKTARWKKTLNLRIHYIAILCAVFLTIGMTQSANAGTFTVNNNGDSAVIGSGSLRAAILEANGSPGPHTISFAGFSGTITPSSPLPAITSNDVLIDGFTANGVTLNTAAIGSGFNGTLTVELDGSSAGSSGIGLRISASNCTIRGLVINRFQTAGIRIDRGSSNTNIVGNNNVFGNFIGTNLAGTAALGNFNYGILIVGSTGNNIGNSTQAFTRNVISGNLGDGIAISGGGSATIRRNLIGTDKNGTADLGNTRNGVAIVDSSGSLVGTSTNSRNIISGNNANGVSIIQGDSTTIASGNSIAGNYIGVNIGGNTALGNNGSGIAIQAAGNTVGGNAATAGNVISGNAVNGIAITSSLATNTLVIKNMIGVGADGSTAVGNVQSGIRIASLAQNNTIGGANSTLGVCGGVCNLIANNGNATAVDARAGIYVTSTGRGGNSIRGNSIFNNFGIGIDLDVPGSNANDADDGDTGANNIQNYPVISAADTNGSVSGTLSSTINTLFEIDFFRNATAADDAMGNEGRFFIGTTSVFVNNTGTAPFSFGATTPVASGEFITATATSTAGAAQTIGDTSEFSATQTVVTASGSGGAGLEGDVISRPNGDGIIAANDVEQIRRFSVGADTPFQSNEFQRADCSPAGTRGNGLINASDIEQARRYSVGLDTKQTAGGPTSAARPNAESRVKQPVSVAGHKPESPQAGRAVRIVSQTGMPNDAIIVPINVDTEGDEAGYTFSISFDNTKLTANNVVIGDLGGNVVFGIDNANGTIGFSINSFTGGTIARVTNQTLVRVNFTINAGVTGGTTPLNFTDDPSPRNVSGTNPNLPIDQPTYENGSVTINAPSGGRAVRVISQDSSANQTVMVPINVDTQGDEAGYTFSISFDNTQLTANNVTIGDLGGNVVFGINNANGTIGISVNSFTGGTIAAVTNQTLVRIMFTVNAAAMTGETPLNFTDDPSPRNVSGTNPNLPIDQPVYENGVINILAPSAAGVNVTGRVFASKSRSLSDALVVLTDSQGNTLKTRSNSFGFFTFIDVPAGQTYILSVTHRRYTFSSQAVSINDNIANLSVFAEK